MHLTTLGEIAWVPQTNPALRTSNTLQRKKKPAETRHQPKE